MANGPKEDDVCDARNIRQGKVVLVEFGSEGGDPSDGGPRPARRSRHRRALVDLTAKAAAFDTPHVLGRLRIICTSLAAAGLLCGCSSTESESAAASAVGSAGLTLVVLGSSTASGFGLADPSESWVARYSAFLAQDDAANRLVNLAVPGFTTYQVLATDTENPPHAPAVDPAHNVTTALAETPDAIVVNLPSNDASWKFPVEETMQNLGQLASGGEAAGANVWVATSQPRNLDEEGMALLEGLRDETLSRFGERALDFWTPLAAPDGKMLPDYDIGDGVHPNAAGHELLFEVIRAADIPGALASE